MANIRQLVIILFCLFLIPSFAGAASFAVTPTSGLYSVGNSFSVAVYVNSSDQVMNTASGVVSFSADKLEVVSISKTGSIFSLWVPEIAFSNSKGTVNFSGVVFNPGFVGSRGNLFTIKFKVKATGIANLNFVSGSILANDGSGTEIFTGSSKATFDLKKATTKPVEVPPKEKTVVAAKPAIVDIANDLKIREIQRKEQFDPRAMFVFEVSKKMQVTKYEVGIDNGEIVSLPGENPKEYKTSALSVGQHIITVKALDKTGKYLTSSSTFSIEYLPTPKLVNYPKTLSSKEPLILSGSAYPFSEIKIFIQGQNGDAMSFNAIANKDGLFTFSLTEGLTEGVYNISVEASNLVGAISLPSEKVMIDVYHPLTFFLKNITAIDTSTLIIVLCVAVIILLLILLGVWFSLSKLKKRLHEGGCDIEKISFEPAYSMLEDLKKNIVILESVSSVRKLTREEKIILEKLKKDLIKVELEIAKEAESLKS